MVYTKALQTSTTVYCLCSVCFIIVVVSLSRVQWLSSLLMLSQSCLYHTVERLCIVPQNCSICSGDLVLPGTHHASVGGFPYAVWFLCCRDREKGEALGQLFKRINESLESTGSFPTLGKEQRGSPAQPQAHVWTQFQLAQHYDMQGRTGGRTAHALQSCNLWLTSWFSCEEQPLYANSCVNAEDVVCSPAVRRKPSVAEA